MSSSIGDSTAAGPSSSFFQDEYVEASLFARPSAPGDTIVRIKTPTLSSLGYLQKDHFVQTLISAKNVAAIAASEIAARTT